MPCAEKIFSFLSRNSPVKAGLSRLTPCPWQLKATLSGANRFGVHPSGCPGLISLCPADERPREHAKGACARPRTSYGSQAAIPSRDRAEAWRFRPGNRPCRPSWTPCGVLLCVPWLTRPEHRTPDQDCPMTQANYEKNF
jgi:hypothetical protein